jgi:hypothetical protein
LTPKGLDLERQLTEKQRARIARAYRQAGAEAVEGFRKVLLGIINEHDRRLLQPQTPAAGPPARGPAALTPPREGRS